MKRLFTTFCLMASLALPALALAPVYAAGTPQQEVCQGIGLTTSGGGCGDNGVQFSNVVTSIINLLLIIIGLVAVIMIIIAGFNFITSGGDSGKVTTAKNSIVYAIIGLIIVAFAEVIVHFVINAAQG